MNCLFPKRCSFTYCNSYMQMTRIECWNFDEQRAYPCICVSVEWRQFLASANDSCRVTMADHTASTHFQCGNAHARAGRLSRAAVNSTCHTQRAKHQEEIIVTFCQQKSGTCVHGTHRTRKHVHRARDRILASISASSVFTVTTLS